MHNSLKARPSDPARDFCQWPYNRPAPPGPAALRQSALLFAALAYRPDGARLAEMLARVRAYFGAFNTVWGLKTDGTSDALAIELYFYDYDRAERTHPLSQVAQALPDLLPVPLRDLDRVPFFMWSVEFPADGGSPATIDIYSDGFGGTASGGICHAWDGSALSLKNLYHFFETTPDAAQINTALASSARTSRLLPLPDWLQPGAWREEIFVFAQKRASDAVYFSRLTTAATLALCERAGFPGWLTRAMATDQSAFAHHLWDVGVDYAGDEGKAQPLKAGLYGLL